jgi:iron complex transport system permease protein
MFRKFFFVALLIGLALAFVLSVSLGSVRIPTDSVLRVLLGSEAERETWRTIIWQFRLPKAITATLAGAALAIAGLQMQTLFRNPLADPFVLGISSGASLGVALVVLAGSTVGASLLGGLGLFANVGVVTAASVGSGLVFALIVLVSRRIHNNVTLLVLGLMMGYVVSAAVSILLYFSVPDQVQAYINWTFGSFGGTTWGNLQVLVPVVLMGLALAFVSVKPLNALLLGEAYARSMGVNVTHARVMIAASASLLAGAVTAFCGPIGFLGVAVPHLARSLFATSNHKVLAPACVLLGATLALLCDLATYAGKFALPLNAVTSLIGAPVVMWMILRRRTAETPDP